MRLDAVKQGACILITLLALVTSSVAACACSHHEPIETKTEASCHGATHNESPAAVDEAATGNTVDGGCECFAAEYSPAIFSKSKKAQGEGGEKASALPTESLPIFAFVRTRTDAPYFASAKFYERLHRYQAPSRAPPRP